MKDWSDHSAQKHQAEETVIICLRLRSGRCKAPNYKWDVTYKTNLMMETPLKSHSNGCGLITPLHHLFILFQAYFYTWYIFWPGNNIILVIIKESFKKKISGYNYMLSKMANNWFGCRFWQLTLHCWVDGEPSVANEQKKRAFSRVPVVVPLPRLHHTCSGPSIIASSVCSAGVL